ncbi:MAG: hypothetical protein H7833_16555 [Magnetococcus sp. DMHC-1]|nr:hypothetical protein [Magnetococcales bacterium]
MLQNQDKKQTSHPTPAKGVHPEKSVHSEPHPPGRSRAELHPAKGHAPETHGNGGRRHAPDAHARDGHANDTHDRDGHAHDSHARANHAREDTEHGHHAHNNHDRDQQTHLHTISPAVVHHRGQREEGQEEEDIRKELALLIQKNAERKKRQLLFLALYVSLLLPSSYYAFAYFKMDPLPLGVATIGPEAPATQKKLDIMRTVILDTKSSLVGNLGYDDTNHMSVVEETRQPHESDESGSPKILRAEKGPLLITNVQTGKNAQGKYHLRGELFNRGQQTIDRATLRVLFPDQDGTPLMVQQVDPLVTQSWVLGVVSAPLEGGASRTFDAEIVNVPAEWSGNITMEITHFEATEPKREEKSVDRKPAHQSVGDKIQDSVKIAQMEGIPRPSRP